MLDVIRDACSLNFLRSIKNFACTYRYGIWNIWSWMFALKSSMLRQCFFKESSGKHQCFRDKHSKNSNDHLCLHRNHQCFINIAYLSHRCLFNEQACFFYDNINETSMLPMCSRLGRFCHINICTPVNLDEGPIKQRWATAVSKTAGNFYWERIQRCQRHKGFIKSLPAFEKFHAVNSNSVCPAHWSVLLNCFSEVSCSEKVKSLRKFWERITIFHHIICDESPISRILWKFSRSILQMDLLSREFHSNALFKKKRR